jgi:hypothetical protein
MMNIQRLGCCWGVNCTQALKPSEVIPGEDTDPYAIRSDFGWGVIGMVGGEDGRSTNFTNRTVTKEVNPGQIQQMFELDFAERNSDTDEEMSIEDRRFMEIVKNEMRRMENGHFEVPLPLMHRSIGTLTPLLKRSPLIHFCCINIRSRFTILFIMYI